MKIRIISLSACAIISISLSVPVWAMAAGSLRFDVPPSVHSGDRFEVSVTVDPGEDAVNALSGSITVGPHLAVVGILNSDGLVPLWIQAPDISSDQKSLSFAGIVPGGFTGAHELLSMIVSASSSGPSSIQAPYIEARANDGKATLIPIQAVPASFMVLSGQGTSTVALNDTIPPEPFAVSIDQSPSLFGGAPFAAFNAEDKQSGIDHYEAAYSFFGQPGADQWMTAVSPYELPAAAFGKMLYVKAVDRAGNVRIASVAAPGYYTRVGIFVILALLILCALSIATLRSRRSRRLRSS